MKQKLVEEKTRLEADLNIIASKKGAKFPDYGRSDEDNATEIGDYTATAATETALTERLRSIDEALQRIQDNTYGITAEGEFIPENRLKANPAATTLVIQ
jgi:RNA polymerase-binding transcription factor DksA